MVDHGGGGDPGEVGPGRFVDERYSMYSYCLFGLFGLFGFLFSARREGGKGGAKARKWHWSFDKEKEDKTGLGMGTTNKLTTNSGGRDPKQTVARTGTETAGRQG